MACGGAPPRPCLQAVASPTVTVRRVAATDKWARSFPLQVFQFADKPGPRPGFLLRQVNPWDLTSAPLSLSRASCQGDDRIGFRVKGTNLVFLILSLLSLPPTFPSSLLSFFLLLLQAAIKSMEAILKNCEQIIILLKQDLLLGFRK